MSTGGKSPKSEQQIEKENIPYANKFYDKRGYDYHRPNKKTHDVVINGKFTEEKYRIGTYEDVLIEIIQDMRGLGGEIQKALGWFYTEHMIYFHYFMGCETGKGPRTLHRFNWSKLKPWIWKRLEEKRFHKFQTSIKGYGLTLNYVIPIKEIPKKYFEKIVMRYD